MFMNDCTFDDSSILVETFVEHSFLWVGVGIVAGDSVEHYARVVVVDTLFVLQGGIAMLLLACTMMTPLS